MTTTTPFERLVEATRVQYETEILGHPLLDKVLNHGVTEELYVGYLVQTAHLVRHTPRFLALTSARFGDEDRELRRYFLCQAHDEDGHDKMCLKDLRALGYDPDVCMGGNPERGAWQLITQSYYTATVGDPHGNLGLASLTEEMGATIAGTVSSMLEGKHEFSSRATTFLRAHSGFDVKHLDMVKDAINSLTDSRKLAAAIFGRRMAITGYSQLFTDVLNFGAAEVRATESATN